MAKGFLLNLKAQLSSAPVVIIIEDGRARGVRGNLSDGLLIEFSGIARSHGIREGIIRVHDEVRGPVLQFVGEFSDDARQRFRNVWFARPELKKMRA
jgi:hypothetical protein